MPLPWTWKTGMSRGKGVMAGNTLHSQMKRLRLTEMYVLASGEGRGVRAKIATRASSRKDVSVRTLDLVRMPGRVVYK